MKLHLTLILVAAMTVGTRASTPQSVGLVLSGGGAKGIAHIGVIQALEEHNIPIDYIAGTSMGAIVGGLYAAGYTPDEMMTLICSPGFTDWSTGTINPNLTYYIETPEAEPAIVHFNLGAGDRDTTGVSSILPTSLINPLPMNFAFMELFAAYTAQCGGDFDRLFVPFRCVTSDVYAKHKLVLGSGSLGDAIRASMSFPLVFHPIDIDGVPVYDGGIYDNFPVNVMHTTFAPDQIIGVDVSTHVTGPRSNDIVNQLEDMIIQNNDYSLPDSLGIKIHIDLSQFTLLDFAKAREIYAIGYKRGMEMIDSIERRITSRMPAEARNLRREVFKSATPYLRFDSVEVSGASRSQDEYLNYLFTHHSADTFGIERARDSYYRAITSGKLKNLLPQAVYDDSTELFTLRLRATVKDRIAVGVGGYISSSTSSLLYASVGYNTLSFNSMSSSLGLWLGQSYVAAALRGRLNFPTAIPTFLMLEGVLSRAKYGQKESYFFKENQPTFVSDTEAFGRLVYGIAAGRRGKIEVSAGYGYLEDRYYESTSNVLTPHTRDRIIRRLAEGMVRYHRSTLDVITFPTSGSEVELTGIVTNGRRSYRPYDGDLFAPYSSRYTMLQGSVSLSRYFTGNRHFVLGTSLCGLWSNRGLLSSYNATLVEAPTFRPTPSAYNSFNSSLKANSYVAATLTPVWKITELMHLRTSLNAFVPVRRIKPSADLKPRYGALFADPTFFGEVRAIINMPFGSLSAYADYVSGPTSDWNFGISFGIFMLAPKFLH